MTGPRGVVYHLCRKGRNTMTRRNSFKLTGDEIKAIIDTEQAKNAAAGNMDAQMALARVLSVIARQEHERIARIVAKRKTSVAGKSHADAQADVWPPAGC